MVTPPPELDQRDARARMERAAAEAKRLEEAGRGFEANAAWERYELIAKALAASERVERIERIERGRSA